MAKGKKPPPEVEVQVAGRTDVGLVREHNEDSLLMVRLDDDQREGDKLAKHTLGKAGSLFIVCDGMGGAAAGEVASSMAVASVAGSLTKPPGGKAATEKGAEDRKLAVAKKLRAAVQKANSEIHNEAVSNEARSGMGTTLTAIYLFDRSAVIAQVGDSRCYVWRKGKLAQMTRDQSLVNQLIEGGHITAEQAKYFEHSNVILQALGVQPEVDVQISRFDLRAGDRIMLCSDGLVGMVPDEDIAEVMGSVEDPEEAARELIDLANASGGPDNITVVVAYVKGSGLAQPTDADALTYERWRLEPEQPAAPAPEPVEAEPDTKPIPKADPTPTTPLPTVSPTPAPAAARPQPMAEMLSMALVLGLGLGGAVAGVGVHMKRVPCEVRSMPAKDGVKVWADGHPAGVETQGGSAKFYLKPGKHTVGLRDGEHSEAHADVDVTEGGQCMIQLPVGSSSGRP